MQTVLLWLTHYGYPALFSLLLLGVVGLPIPDETLLTFCGYLIYSGRFHPAGAFLAGFLGSTCGISVSYLLGARFGEAVFSRYGGYVGLTRSRMTRTKEIFQRFGPGLLTVGYFVPGVRHFTAIVAGMSQLSFRRFALFAYAGAALWVTAFLSLGYLFGERWEHSSELVHQYTLIGIGLAIGVGCIVWLVRRVMNRRAKIDQQNDTRLQ